MVTPQTYMPTFPGTLGRNTSFCLVMVLYKHKSGIDGLGDNSPCVIPSLVDAEEMVLEEKEENAGRLDWSCFLLENKEWDGNRLKMTGRNILVFVVENCFNNVVAVAVAFAVAATPIRNLCITLTQPGFFVPKKKKEERL